MTVTIYRSTDASAPVLTGQVGSLLTLLDACLVNGYGSQPAAGWTKPFVNSSNIGCYQNSPAHGTGFCLNVDDNAHGTGGAQEANCTGFESMSALSTGTGQFPLSSQVNLGTSPAGSVVARKSASANATARAWTLMADDTVFYLFMDTGDLANTSRSLMFGDIVPYKVNDTYRCLIVGATTANSSSVDILAFYSSTTLNTTNGGHFMPRLHTGMGGSLNVCKSFMVSMASGGPPAVIGAAGGAGAFPYPNGPDGGFYMSPVWIGHGGFLRGYLKGFWASMHSTATPFNHGDVIQGTGAMSGKTFQAFNLNGSSLGQIFMETSPTWA